MEALLTYDRVTIQYRKTEVVRNMSFAVDQGEILGIVGESGSGNSTLLHAAMGILGPGHITEGCIRLGKTELTHLGERKLRRIRGKQMGMIHQDTRASLCPIRTIESQIHEMMAAHGTVTKAQACQQALELFEKLGFPDGRRILKSYPFQLSGGMNQRVGIAMAMLLRPVLLLADEPTSALDAAVQKQVVEELLQLRDLYGTAIVLVTHNMSVLSAMADTILVLRAGEAVEYGAALQVLQSPQAAYTQELLDAVPKLRRR